MLGQARPSPPAFLGTGTPAAQPRWDLPGRKVAETRMVKEAPQELQGTGTGHPSGHLAADPPAGPPG